MATYKLELSLDPLSDTTPTWVDITAYCFEASYSRSGGGDLDDPDAGSASFTLDNADRRFEPEYAASPYYPNIKPLRRVRFSIDGDIEFTGFVSSWGVGFPGGYRNGEVTVSAVDGQHLAELEALPALDPPDATAYEEVIDFDQPWGYWRLGEESGTKLVVQGFKSKKKRRQFQERTGRKRRRRIITASEVEGQSGPSGTYKGLPTLGVPGLILGDLDTAVRFDGINDFARIGPLDEEDLIKKNVLTLEAWVSSEVSASGTAVIVGPRSSAFANGVFSLTSDTGLVTLRVYSSDGGVTQAQGATVMSPGVTYHIAGTWDGTTAIVYLNAVEDGRTVGARVLATGDVDEFLYIGKDLSGVGTYFKGTLDEVAIYEKALTPERVLAHYYAGALRGYAEQTAGARIAAIMTHDLWGIGSIQTTGLNVQPQMQYGQTMMEELQQTWEAEKPQRTFYFSGAGNPVYLGWDFGDSAPYNTVTATFGDGPGEVPYTDIALDYPEDDIYNEVTISRDGGEAQMASDDDSQDEYRLRRYQQSGLILSEDEDAALIADTVSEMFKQPELVVSSIALHGGDPPALAQIKAREPGQLVRIKARPNGGTAIDRVCRVKSKTVSVPRGAANRFPVCTLTFTRGFDASTTEWHLGTIGFTELGTGTVLA